MIDKAALAEAARNTDAYVEEYGIEQWMRSRDLDPGAVSYVINQRALRAAMIIDGQDPSLLSRTEKTDIQLSERARELMPMLQAVVLDGIAIGMTVKGNEYGKGKKIG